MHVNHCWILIAASLFRQSASFLYAHHQHLRATSHLQLEAPSQGFSLFTNTTLLVPPFDTSSQEQYPSRLHNIYIHSLLSDAEASQCLELAKSYAKTTGRWDSPDSVRHATYATCDFAIDECDPMNDYLESIQFDQRIFKGLETRYGIPAKDMSYLDLFCANYQGGSSATGMDRLEAHRDGSLLSFSITLSPPNMYQGGGTFFDAMRDVPPNGITLFSDGVVRPPRAGDCVMHCGKLLHGADVVTGGERTVLVGFVEVNSLWQRPGVLGKACRDFGRMDVAALRHKNQQLMTNKGEKRGWLSRNKKWLSDSGSHVRGFLPVFHTAAKRANPEFQRLQKLMAEDWLLRNVLFMEMQENTQSLRSLFDGDEVTILG